MSSNMNEIYSIACDICDKNVTIVNKKKKDNKTIWTCNDCDSKYPRWKN